MSSKRDKPDRIFLSTIARIEQWVIESVLYGHDNQLGTLSKRRSAKHLISPLSDVPLRQTITPAFCLVSHTLLFYPLLFRCVLVFLSMAAIALS